MNINASDLSRFVFCPRAIYLTEVAGVKPKDTPEKNKGLVGHAIRKELSMRQAKVLKKASSEKDVKPLLTKEFEAVMLEAPAIYREKLYGIDVDKYFKLLHGQLTRELKSLENELSAMISEMGVARAVEYTTPWRVEYSARSDKLRLSGRIDKVFSRETHIPVEIKTGRTPENVWESDRIQVTAYVMLLEEKFDEKITHGFVEYTQQSQTRPVLASEKSRREVLRVRDEIIDILGGRVPEICEHGSGKKCEGCGLMKECYKL